MQERVFLIKWETKILFMLDRKMKWNNFIWKKPLPKPQFKWRVDGNFEAKKYNQGGFWWELRYVFKTDIGAALSHTVPESLWLWLRDLRQHWGPRSLPVETSGPEEPEMFYLLPTSRNALYLTDKQRKSIRWMKRILAVQITLLSTSTTKWPNFQLLLFPRNVSLLNLASKPLPSISITIHWLSHSCFVCT